MFRSWKLFFILICVFGTSTIFAARVKINDLTMEDFVKVVDVTVGDSCDKIYDQLEASIVQEGIDWFLFDLQGPLKVFCDEDTWFITKIEVKSTDVNMSKAFKVVGNTVRKHQFIKAFEKVPDEVIVEIDIDTWVWKNSGSVLKVFFNKDTLTIDSWQVEIREGSDSTEPISTGGICDEDFFKLFDKTVAKVIYGNDNRIDSCFSDNSMLIKASFSTAAMFMDCITHNNDNTYTLQWSGTPQIVLCAGEPFAGQADIASCTGFLVEQDVLVTAGHCIKNEEDCEKVKWVFDYHANAQGEIQTVIDESKVVGCEKIINRTLAGGLDYAVLKLDRPVDREPLEYRKDGKVDDGAKMALIGYPSGLPSKIAEDATILRNDNPVFFVASTDSYGGNSGSPVINMETGLVEGILVRGESDYVYDSDNSCHRSVMCPQSGDNCRGEDVVRITSVDFSQQTDPVYVNDAYEPNDSFSTATTISLNSQYSNLKILKEDVDTFKINLPKKGSLVVKIYFTHAKGDIDLILFDRYGDKIAKSESTTDNETIETEYLSAGTYYIVVKGYAGEVLDSNYDLDNGFTPEPVPLIWGHGNADYTKYMEPETIYEADYFVVKARKMNCRADADVNSKVTKRLRENDKIYFNHQGYRPIRHGKELSAGRVWFLTQHSCWIAANWKYLNAWISE